MALGFKFESGPCVATPGALEDLGQEGVVALIVRHLRGDWGDLCEEDRQLNEEAIKDGSRILSKYTVGDGEYYVITEAIGDDGHRAASTALRVDEY